MRSSLHKIVGAALIAAACNDAVAPRSNPDAPLFSFAATGVTPGQQNGTLGENGRILIKGFNPQNPHHGDAIIATFYWVGSTNIIDSVTDVLTIAGFPRVGNTYNLVEYVTAGGISMATYVATNVQGFPDSYNAPAQDSILAVRAHLRDSVPDGGIKISAWTGVEDVYATALGAHRSASGSGSAPTIVAPGPITLDAGAMAYAATMSNAVVGSDPPPDFTSIGGSGSDALLREDGRYRVVTSTTTVNPQWTWNFSQQQPGTWLASILALRAGVSSTAGNLTITASTSGSNLDPNGYTVTVDGNNSQPVATNGSVTFANLPPGSHTVTLSGVATNCTVTSGNPETVTVSSGSTTTATSSVSCSAAPPPPPPPPPPAGIALSRESGGLGGAGRLLLARFAPANPHVGDAIIATFFWLGSTNIVDSVVDVLTDGPQTRVGNQYHPVEYVTTGGISMATYVATNVQNFPDTSSDGGRSLVVRAYLSDSVPDGGVRLSAWTGVEGAFAQALSTHQSGSGAGSTATVADPGAIAVGTGALAYGVTMSNGVVGLTPPPDPFVVIGGSGSDASIKEDARYFVAASATSADPRWTWQFSSPRSWLATALALNAASGGTNQPPTANFTFSCSALTCSFTSTSSDPDGSIAAYSWNFGDGATSTAQNPSHTYSAGGSYTVTLRVTDNQGAQSTTATQSVTVSPANQPPTASFTFSCSALACSFTSTSSDPDGSIAGYSWTFGDGATSTVQNPSHTYSAGGSYTVTLRVTDNQGAQSTTATQSVTVTPANQPPTASFTFSCSALACSFTSTSSDPDGSIAAYSWTFGDGATSTVQNPSHTYAAGGSYTVTLRVTDNQGAQSTTATQSVTVSPANQPPTANFTFSCSALTCSFTSTSSDPDGSIAAYSWNFGDGATSTAQNPSHTFAAGGSYTVTLRVTDNQGAQSTTASQNVTVTPANQPPTANFTFSCSGLTCSFTSTSSDPDGTISAYSWTFGDGATSTAQNPSHTFAAAGSYTVTLTVTDNQGTASAPASRTVGVTAPNQPPTASFTRSCSALTCNFTSTSSDPDGSIASYSWNFGDGATSTAQNPSHTYAAGGTYTVTLQVTDNQGAQSTTASQNVIVTPPNQPPTASFTRSCSALTCNFTSTSSDPDGSIASYAWTFGDGATSTVQNPSHTYASGGTFTVTLRVTDNQGAQSTTASQSVTVTPPNQPPTASFTFTCSALACSFTSTSSDADGSIASYSWNFGDGTTSTVQNPSHTYASGGAFTVTLRVTDNQGAQSTTASQNVTVTPPNQPPTASFTFSCSALACSFTSTSSDPDGSIASYAWTFGDGATSTLQNPSHTYAAGGTYTVTLRVTDNQGAQSTMASQNVTVTPPNQPPTASFTFSCSALACSFTSTSSDPDGSIASYAWTFGDGATSTAANPSHTFASGGTYTVTLRVTDNQGAQSTTASQNVTVTPPNQPPTASFSKSCSGLTCSFTSTSSDPDGSIASYSWNFGDGATSTAQNPSHTYAAGGTYTVTLRVTDNQGAQSTTASQNVSVTPPNQPPTANFTSSCSGLACSFTSTSSDPDGSIASYSWNFGDGATSTAQNPSHTYAAGGTYSVTLQVTDNQGAQSTTTSKNVTVTQPNSPPVVNAGGDESAVTGLLYSSTQSFSDANGNGPWSYQIDWGDGSVSTGTRTGTGSFTVGHTYVIVLPRSFTVTVTVTDAAGASGSDSKVVSVLLL